MQNSKISNHFEAAVIIPFYNEESYIKGTLQSLLNQETPPNFRWVVVFVDNNSTDKTVQIINNSLQNSGVLYRVIKEKRQGIGYSRACGLRYASKQDFEILITTDADTKLPSNFVYQTYVDLFKNKADVVSGKRSEDGKIKLWQRFVAPRLFNAKRKIRNLEYLCFGPYVFGAYHAIRASFFRKLKGYNPGVHQKYMGEDALLSRRSYYEGAKFVRSSVSVIPSPRRIYALKEKFVGPVLWDYAKSRFSPVKKSTLNFAKIPEKKEEILIEEIIKFEAERFLWTLADAYLYWLKDSKKRKMALICVRRTLKLFRFNNKDFLNKIVNFDRRKSFTLLKKAYAAKARKEIANYVNKQT